jgi:hypothetical protein
MDLATAAGVPEPITLGGREFSARLLTMRERATLQAFLKSRLQSPVTRTAIAIQEARNAGTPIDRDLEDRMQDRAEAAALKWPPRFGSSAWFEAMDGTEGGYEQVLYEVLSKTDPGFTLAQAEALATDVTLDEWGELFRVAFWGTPPAPKGGGANGTPPTPSSPSATTGQD